MAEDQEPSLRRGPQMRDLPEDHLGCQEDMKSTEQFRQRRGRAAVSGRAPVARRDYTKRWAALTIGKNMKE
jgi:hypothetical protein